MSTTKKVKTKASDLLVLAILAYLLTLIAPLLSAIVNPYSLVANIIYKLMNCICIHIVLQNGVCQKLDGSQRRF